jgi:cytochrome c biogenesis protein CcmG, thiol:disulfide interchange protein DsbE
MKTLRYCIPLVFLVLLFGLLWRSLAPHDEVEIPSTMVGKVMPAFYLSDLRSDSRTIHSQELLGTPILFNVWATWCITCMAEHAFLMKIKQQNQIRIIGLNYRDDQTAAQQWLKTHGDPYQTVLFDPTGKTAIDFGIYGTPETFIIDQKGIVRYRYAGMLTQEVWQTEIVPIFAALNKV